MDLEVAEARPRPRRPDLSAYGSLIADARLTQLMYEIVQGAEDEGGGGQEQAIEKAANKHRWEPIPHDPKRPERSTHNHYASGFDALEERGILEKTMIGGKRWWWLTQAAWTALGHDGPVPRLPSLFDA